jgi:hypothetical protein
VRKKKDSQKGIGTIQYLTDEEEYPIRPSDLGHNDSFLSALGKSETEHAAIWIVNFCQNRGDSWRPFTFEEIQDFYTANGGEGDFQFKGLVMPFFDWPGYSGGSWIIAKEEQYFITTGLVDRLSWSNQKHADQNKKRVGA